jgi:HlyD family secretion protein
VSKKFREEYKLKRTNQKIALITVCAILICTIGGCGKKQQEEVVKTDVVTYGDIKSVITGEASVEAYERFEIISMVSGDIVSSPFEVGDAVKEGDILYQFDTSDALKSIERQEISLEQSKNNLNNSKSDYQEAKEKLSIIAPCSGTISGLTLKKGNDVSNNQQIATVKNTRDLEVSLPFTSEQIDKIYIGQSANVSSSIHMSIVAGKVSSISSESTAQDNGSKTYNVTIDLENPGAFTEGLTVGAEIAGMQSPGFGTIEYSETGTVKAEATGTVKSVNYSNGDFVQKGAVIATISSDALSSQERSLESNELNYKSAQLSMSESRDSLDDYSITSPISGTVITKNAKAGDTIDRTNSSTALMVVSDISKLKFNLEIDELDIRKVHEEQEVDITCDALPNEKFKGKITSISVEGTATNGVTTYTAEVVVDEPGNLRPSMNVDASVIIESAENVLMIPSGDIKTVMGVSYVFLKDETGERGATEEDFMSAMRGGKKSEQSKMPQFKGNKDEKSKERKSMLPEAPEGFVIAIVETGISDNEYIEIKSGLKEFDEVQSIVIESTSSNRMMEMMGAMHGGGMPAGGGRMPGGMR